MLTVLTVASTVDGVNAEPSTLKSVDTHWQFAATGHDTTLVEVQKIQKNFCPSVRVTRELSAIASESFWWLQRLLNTGI